MSSSGHQDIPPTLGSLIANKFLNSVAKQFPSSQQKRGDQKLERARETAHEYESVISESDQNVVKERIIFAREIKDGLDSKSGFSKFHHAREYRRAARDAYRFAKHVSDRGRDDAYFSRPRGTSSTPASEDTSDAVMRVARPLYRCYLSCKDAFPSPYEEEEWVAAVWSEACARSGESLRPLPQDEGFLDKSTKLLINMKMKIMHAVESLYGFDTSRAPDIISHNARLAQALLTNMAFIYREPNVGGIPHHPYRHPIIQKAINITWFQNKDSDGIVFHEYFTPIPIQAIALVLTVIECCINDWTDGTRRASSWDEGRYKTVYHSHISSLNELRDHGHPQGGDLLTQIQQDLLKDARIHAGAPCEPVTGSGRFQPAALDAAVEDDLPAYPDYDSQIPTIEE